MLSTYLPPLERLHVEVGPLDVVLVLPAGLHLLLGSLEGLLPAEDHLLPHGGVLLVGRRLLAVALALLAGG